MARLRAAKGLATADADCYEFARDRLHKGESVRCLTAMPYRHYGYRHIPITLIDFGSQNVVGSSANHNGNPGSGMQAVTLAIVPNTNSFRVIVHRCSSRCLTPSETESFRRHRHQHY